MPKERGGVQVTEDRHATATAFQGSVRLVVVGSVAARLDMSPDEARLLARYLRRMARLAEGASK